MGPHGGPGHGDPRVHRLPAADGAVLRRLPPPRRAGLGGPAAVAGLHPLRAPGSASSTCRASSACAGPGPTAAALAYMLSPYFLQYAGRISVILLPWAGLPFMLGLTIVALRRGGWREPALFAVVVALVSGINASSIIYVGVAPILWIVYAVVVLRESTWRHAVGAALRIGRPDAGRLPVVDGRPGGGGGLRRQRPEVHRDGPLDVADLQPGRTSSGGSATGTSTARTTSARGRRRPSATPRTSGCWPPPSPCRCCRWWRLHSCAGASAPSSSCCSSSGLILSVGPVPVLRPDPRRRLRSSRS